MTRIVPPLVCLVAAATPVWAEVPRLANNNADYLLMPLLGYVAIIASARGGQLLKRRFLRKRD